MKTLKVFAIASMVVMVGCGGGGGRTDGGGSPTPAPPTTTATPPVVNTVTNPLTGATAPGIATTSVRGAAYAGAVVTAYGVQPDGSAGATLGAPATADINGYFTITTAAAPMGMVRLAAIGGKVTRAADNTVQPGGTLTLVTPFVTSEYNDFKISPLTDIAANAMAYQASKGATLAQAFSGGMQNLLALDSANTLLMQDKAVYLNVLKGSVKSETMYYGAQSLQSKELLDGLEYLGVMLDLPSAAVAKVVGASAQGGYAAGGVDGAGNAINAGAWVIGAFVPTAPMTLKALMDAKTPDAQKVFDGATGTKVAPRLAEVVSRFLISDFLMDAACRSGSSPFYTTRYPFYQVDAQGKMFAADCAAAAQRLLVLKAHLDTNNSSTMR
ncbi:hypothetical protein BN2497_3227 [Janthinobacterium sp. CG23_2]|nr:hypothetical protein BN2497_3227 [Janthinobacterium sp. CG23_2]CUU28011.1 hypothetical protein BN3177_3227 [Janthinobacterium sp. CG23_2]